MRHLGRYLAAAALLLGAAGCDTPAPAPGSAPPAPTTNAPAATTSASPAPGPSVTPSPTPSASAPSKRPGPGPSDPSVPPAENAAELTVVYRADGTTDQVWTLTCAPDGGDHPDPAAACAALAAAGAAPFAVAPDQLCSQQYGGPQTATVTGSALGQQISSTFNRRNGCEIARWQRLEDLLPAV